MKAYLEKVKSLVVEQAMANTSRDPFSHRLQCAIEELGELARAHRDFMNSSPADEHACSEHQIEEAADCIICSLALYTTTGGTMEQLNELFERKTDKWRRNIAAKVD